MPKISGLWGVASELGDEIWTYRRTQEPTHEVHGYLRWLYFHTNGYSAKLMLKALESRCRPCGVAEVDGDSKFIARNDEEAVREKCIGELARDGIGVIPFRLPAATCEALRAFACEHESSAWRMSVKQNGSDLLPDWSFAEKAVFDPQHIAYPFYNFADNVVASNETVQQIITDPFFLRLAVAQFGRLPVIEKLALEWNTGKGNDGVGPRPYHRDTGSLRFIKFLMFLTDVEPDDGAHVFIRKSHAPSYKALRNGSGLIPEATMRRLVPAEDFIRVTGPAGTILVGDTIGYHKGEFPRNPRLTLQFQMNASLLGYPNHNKYQLSQVSSELAAARERFPEVYSCLFAHSVGGRAAETA